jgi:hypothetical protein
MRRLLAFLRKRRKPVAPAPVEISWNCMQGDQLSDQYIEWMKKHIRPRGDSGPGVRL